jgi:hypothetical protein
MPNWTPSHKSDPAQRRSFHRQFSRKVGEARLLAIQRGHPAGSFRLPVNAARVGSGAIPRAAPCHADVRADRRREVTHVHRCRRRQRAITLPPGTATIPLKWHCPARDDSMQSASAFDAADFLDPPRLRAYGASYDIVQTHATKAAQDTRGGGRCRRCATTPA